MQNLSSTPPAEIDARIQDLLHRACPDRESVSFFIRNMSIASAREMPYAEALHFVIQQRVELT